MDDATEQVKALENEFANRYTADDDDFKLVLSEEDHIPPILTNWVDQGRNRSYNQRDSGSFDQRGLYNDRPRDRYDDRSRGGRYDERSREDRGRYDRDYRRSDGRDDQGSNKRPRNNDYYGHDDRNR